jgi:CheY-like chemotaxis protein
MMIRTFGNCKRTASQRMAIVHTVVDGKKVLDTHHVQQFDGMILDITMPCMTVWTASNCFPLPWAIAMKATN